MIIHIVFNTIYSFVVLGISMIYYYYEKPSIDEKKYKRTRTLSIDMFDKYLNVGDNTETLLNDDSSKGSDTEENKKEEAEEISGKISAKPSLEIKKDYGIRDIIHQIKIESRNFLLSEFRLILYFSLIIATFFYFAGKDSISFYFVISFLIGVLISLICVYYSTSIAVENCEIVLNCAKFGIDEAFKSSINLSSKMSILMMSISYYSFFIFSLILRHFLNSSNLETFEILCGYGFGCTYSALFCRIAGGIFTKGADISCDVVGKMERDLEENDRRNPSSIADNVGDLIGDLAGSILDLVASIAETFCAVTLILAYMEDLEMINMAYISSFFSILSTSQLIFIIVEVYMSYSTKYEEIISENDIEGYLFKIIQLTTFGMLIAIIIIFILFVPMGLAFNGVEISKYVIMTTVILGLLAGYLICYSTYYYTGKSFKLIQELARITTESPALNVIYGLSIGFLSTLAPMLIIGITVLLADHFCGIFGIAFASFGFLLNLPVILLYQMFGPTADVSLGITHILKYDTGISQFINQLDITGNTMSAVVKGFASGSAGLVSFGIYGAVMLSAQINLINLYEISSIVFLLFGGVFTYLIQALCMYSTSQNAILLIDESRKQISSRKLRSSMTNNEFVKPDYYECIQLSAQHAFRKATIITWICFFVNLGIGEFFGFKGLVSFLSGAIIAGIPITISSSNSGSAWDNSKKIIETTDQNLDIECNTQNINNIDSSSVDSEEVKEAEKEVQVEGKKESEFHDPHDHDEESHEEDIGDIGGFYRPAKNITIKAKDEPKMPNLSFRPQRLPSMRRQSIKNAIIGDNIGDAFKDIAGPAINILIKFSSYFSLIMVNYLLIK